VAGRAQDCFKAPYKKFTALRLRVIPAKAGIQKISYMDSPIKSGHDNKKNNEKYPSAVSGLVWTGEGLD
jgi:hypothetical protein